ncbi:MAG: hypothetical protein JWM80_2534, partial [Cyanobacteria bacterium RYN_339]|nr:hypothetical protein [Cyanobacteria bacterium RYN_339]
MGSRWWTSVAAIRKLIGAFLRPLLPQPTMADLVGLAAHELLENALKYSVGTESQVRCRVFVQRDRVCLRVQNQAHPAVIVLLQEV